MAEEIRLQSLKTFGGERIEEYLHGSFIAISQEDTKDILVYLNDVVHAPRCLAQ